MRHGQGLMPFQLAFGGYNQVSNSAANGYAWCMQVETAAGAVYKPQKRFWYFGLANVLRDRMFSDPTWCRLRGTGRNDPE